MRTKHGSEYRPNRRHLLKSREPLYTNEETSGDDDEPEALTTFSEDRECVSGAESEPALNQRPTTDPPTPVMGSKPSTTRSGLVVKPRVRLDL